MGFYGTTTKDSDQYKDCKNSTVESRYNGFQGTGENHPLLPKSVIAKMTMVDDFLREKKTKEKDPSF